VDLSEKTIKDALRYFGLTETEADVYIFLAKHNISKGTELSYQLKKDKAQVYSILKSLHTKGFVDSTLKIPACFTPVPFERMIESAIETKIEEANRIKSSKQELLDCWNGLNQTKPKINAEKFELIEDKNKIYSKISQMIAQTENQLSIITSVSNLVQADHFGIYDAIFKKLQKDKVEFRFLTHISNYNMKAMKMLLRRINGNGLHFRTRASEFDSNSFPRMVLKDHAETIFFVMPSDNYSDKEHEELCLWTNHRNLVYALCNVFENFWQGSSAVRRRITEIELNTI
jgi:sugar-specific transcriptional regulator TrmB